GEYFLTGFDVKVARSVSDVAHIKGSKENLIKDGKPIGGTFNVSPGEAVYVGHFGLDCGAEPFLWRSYLVQYDFPHDYQIYHFIWALTANGNHAYRKANSVFFTRRRADDDKSLCVGVRNDPT
ncbi:MAG: hypothetical protein LH481_00310, partial [Burkholderiales bacterium]|nr:hypothetical protein [Burkholderiales bacterium]